MKHKKNINSSETELNIARSCKTIQDKCGTQEKQLNFNH
jgi:hypothetical protein